MNSLVNIENASESDTDFSCLSSVKELWISSKKPYQIPDTFTQLESLEKLILGNNCFLPQCIDKLPSLEELWLSDNSVINPPCNIALATSI
jgi:hypothetical protein